MLRKYNYILKNLDCAACANKIQTELSKNKNYKHVRVNFSTLKLSFESEENDQIKKEISKIVKSLEPEVEVLEISDSIEEDKSQNSLLRLGLGVLLALIGTFTNLPFYLSEIITVIAYFVLLFRTTKNAYKIFKSSKSINENFLVTISCIGAYLVGEKFEGLLVIILYEIGKILEEKAINNTRRSIKDLMDIKPEYANLKTENGTETVSPDSLSIGDIIVIKAGEKVPVDGIVQVGSAKLDVAALTGESNLVTVNPNDSILSGSINTAGLLEVKVTCEYQNSTVNKILQLVENATDNKAKTETFVSKAAKIYTPVVLILAILVAIFLPLFTECTYTTSIYRALIFLVISCPCAIAISVPLSYFTGIGKASKEGILIKGSDYLDGIIEIKKIIFDKTGTLTTGSFELEKINILDFTYTEEQVLTILAKGESFSNHPIAKCILNEVENVDTRDVSNYKEISGKGITYEVSGKKVKVGNASLCDCTEEEQEVGTIMYINHDNKVIASVVISDGIKKHSKEMIDSLKRMGIETAMYTGDNKKIAETIAQKLGITEVKAELLPTDKYANLEMTLNNTKHGKIAFVGDGINDAPVLARSDIGISMGGIGSSSAIEASDIVIMTDELKKIITAFDISYKTRKIIKQNLIFALSTKVIVLLLSILGIAGMWHAIFADVGVTLLTILNTTRILNVKKR